MKEKRELMCCQEHIDESPKVDAGPKMTSKDGAGLTGWRTD